MRGLEHVYPARERERETKKRTVENAELGSATTRTHKVDVALTAQLTLRALSLLPYRPALISPTYSPTLFTVSLLVPTVSFLDISSFQGSTIFLFIF